MYGADIYPIASVSFMPIFVGVPENGLQFSATYITLGQPPGHCRSTSVKERKDNNWSMHKSELWPR